MFAFSQPDHPMAGIKGSFWVDSGGEIAVLRMAGIGA
jgi:hypothetical protein